jgi:hypothetical protein
MASPDHRELFISVAIAQAIEMFFPPHPIAENFSNFKQILCTPSSSWV